jgi:hypothetical protein
MKYNRLLFENHRIAFPATDYVPRANSIGPRRAEPGGGVMVPLPQPGGGFPLPLPGGKPIRQQGGYPLPQRGVHTARPTVRPDVVTVGPMAKHRHRPASSR